MVPCWVHSGSALRKGSSMDAVLWMSGPPQSGGYRQRQLSSSSSLVGETLGISLRGHAQPVAGGKGGPFRVAGSGVGLEAGREMVVRGCVCMSD